MTRKLIYTEEKLDELADSLMKWTEKALQKGEFKILKLWCLENKFSNKNFTRHAAKHERFREAYEYAKDYQEYIVASGALTKKLDSGFSQFFLQCCCGWKKEEDVTSKENKARSQLEKICNILSGHKDGVDIEIVD